MGKYPGLRHYYGDFQIIVIARPIPRESLLEHLWKIDNRVPKHSFKHKTVLILNTFLFTFEISSLATSNEIFFPEIFL